MDEEQVWRKMLRSVWDMEDMMGPGDIQGEASKRPLVHGTRDFSGEKCRTGDRVVGVIRDKKRTKAEGHEGSWGGQGCVCEG